MANDPENPRMDRQQQARSDGKDNKRAFRWGIAAFVLLVVLGIGAYNLLLASRAGPPAAADPVKQETPATQPKAPSS